MKLIIAKIKARRYSKKYGTFWYVRQVAPNDYQPYAHNSDDERTVATYFNGVDWSE